MTDAEIKKALECCADEYIHSCDYCPFEKECNGDNLNLVKFALDLINRQTAEIERLQNFPKCAYEFDGEVMDYCLKSPCSNFKTENEIKAEAIKEFAKELINRFSKNNLTQGFYVNISEIDLINLVKEMVGDAE